MLDRILEKYINNERGTDFNLYTPDGINKLLQILGNPHSQIKTVHIAGTNGKGTTSYILARVMENAGYTTGLFISPHLLRLNERISINSSEISDEDLLRYVRQADNAAEESGTAATYFDILTSAAFCYFREKGVDIAVIETGLGGRLDSTNAIIPEVSIITDISMDHSHILGDTVEKITAEKCGIIKPGVPVITTNTDEIITPIITKHADSNGSEIFILNKSFNAVLLQSEPGLYKFKFSFNENEPFIIETSLFPEHQVRNAAAASAALMLLKNKGFSRITAGIVTDTIRNINIPGRFQKLSQSPPVFFDPAHNIASLKNLFSGIKTLFPGFKCIIVLTMMKDKVTDDVLQLLKSGRNEILYYLIDDPRAYIPGENQFLLISGDKSVIIEHIKSEINNRTIILFTGTFRIYSFAVETAGILK